MMRTRVLSLFDRFIPPKGVSDFPDVDAEVAEVIESIKILLNTRSPFSMADCEKISRRTVLDYGMPDFLHLSPVSQEAVHHLARSVQSTILAHEYRITVVSVEINVPRPCRDTFVVLITGVIDARNGKKNVVFPIDVIS